MPDPAPTLSRNDRIAAAIKEASAMESATPAPDSPPAAKSPPPPGAPPPATQASPSPPAEAKPSTVEDRSFEKLAREKAALRAETERLKPLQEIVKAMDPGSLAVLARAKQSGDPLAALNALGFSYADVANRMLDLGGRQKAAAGESPSEEPEPAPQASADFAALRKEVEELKRERAAEQASKARKEVLEKVKEITKNSHRHISGLGEEDAVLQYLEEFHRRTGELPAETFDEAIALAAAAVEKKLEAEAVKWGGFLTTSPKAATLPPEGSRESPSAGTGTAGTTLTNVTTPAGAAPKPVSREEKLKALLADPNVPW